MFSPFHYSILFTIPFSASTPFHQQGTNSPLRLSSTPLQQHFSAHDTPYSPLFSPSFGNDFDVGFTPRTMGGRSLGQLDTPMSWTEDDEKFFPPLMDTRAPSFSQMEITPYFATSAGMGSSLRPAVSALKAKGNHANREQSTRVIFSDGTKGPSEDKVSSMLLLTTFSLSSISEFYSVLSSASQGPVCKKRLDYSTRYFFYKHRVYK